MCGRLAIVSLENAFSLDRSCSGGRCGSWNELAGTSVHATKAFAAKLELRFCRDRHVDVRTGLAPRATFSRRRRLRPACRLRSPRRRNRSGFPNLPPRKKLQCKHSPFWPTERRMLSLTVRFILRNSNMYHGQQNVGWHVCSQHSKC